MRAAACFNAHDALRRQGLCAGQDELILPGVDVVGNHIDFISIPELLAQCLDQRRLARTDRPPNPDTERTVMCRSRSAEGALFALNSLHDRNNLVYWVSWAMEASSTMK